jgi:biopolymer transport protein ExbB
MIEQLTHNWICWAIVVLALICYQQLLLDYFAQNGKNTESNPPHNDTESQANTEVKHAFSGVLIGALPLLGLLGTIIGLLDCFAGIASEGADSELISSGIADALLTTQLGLVCAIPGWLLQNWVKTASLKSRLRKARASLPSSFIVNTAR